MAQCGVPGCARELSCIRVERLEEVPEGNVKRQRGRGGVRVVPVEDLEPCLVDNLCDCGTYMHVGGQSDANGLLGPRPSLFEEAPHLGVCCVCDRLAADAAHAELAVQPEHVAEAAREAEAEDAANAPLGDAEGSGSPDADGAGAHSEAGSWTDE